jgi:hypothetical protein
MPEKKIYRYQVITKNTYPQSAAVVYDGFNLAEAERVLEESWSTRYIHLSEVTEVEA